MSVTEIEHEEYIDEGYGGGYWYSWTEFIYGYNKNNNSTSVSYGYDSITKRLNSISTKSQHTILITILSETRKKYRSVTERLLPMTTIPETVS